MELVCEFGCGVGWRRLLLVGLLGLCSSPPLEHSCCIALSKTLTLIEFLCALACPAALHYAACNGHAEVAGKLVIAGSHVQATGPEVRSTYAGSHPRSAA